MHSFVSKSFHRLIIQKEMGHWDISIPSGRAEIGKRTGSEESNLHSALSRRRISHIPFSLAIVIMHRQMDLCQGAGEVNAGAESVRSETSRSRLFVRTHTKRRHCTFQEPVQSSEFWSCDLPVVWEELRSPLTLHS